MWSASARQSLVISGISWSLVSSSLERGSGDWRARNRSSYRKGGFEPQAVRVMEVQEKHEVPRGVALDILEKRSRLTRNCAIRHRTNQLNRGDNHVTGGAVVRPSKLFHPFGLE